VAEIELYTTDRCSYCVRAKELLAGHGVPFREVYVPRDDVPGRRDLVRRTGLTTMPQILVDGRVLGGWEDLARLEADGRLVRVLAGGA
jgi:glutaredoxin 3